MCAVGLRSLTICKGRTLPPGSDIERPVRGTYRFMQVAPTAVVLRPYMDETVRIRLSLDELPVSSRLMLQGWQEFVTRVLKCLEGERKVLRWR
jgi:hypothetical protein